MRHQERGPIAFQRNRRTDLKRVRLAMQIQRFLKIVLGLTVLAVLIIGVYKADHLWWWVRVGGIRGEKIHVRSEIDGVVQESNLTIPTTFRVSVKKQAIDYWITKTVTNQDLWVSVSGPGWRQSYWVWWKDQEGVHVSIKKGHYSVWKMSYRNTNRDETGGFIP